MSENKETLTVVVNGRPVEIEANIQAPLRTIIPKALEESGNTGQPPENWELRDAAGNLLDLQKKIRDFEFGAAISLFLNLKAGIGG